MKKKKIEDIIKENTAYWAERKDKLVKRTVAESEKALRKIYKNLADDLYDVLEQEMQAIQEGGGRSHQYSYQQYYKARQRIDKLLNKYGVSEIKLLRKGMYETYKKTAGIVDKANKFPDMPPVTDKRALQAIDGIWCSDGKNWSTRIWENQTALAEDLSRGLLSTIEAGTPLEDLKKQIQDKYCPKFYSYASRIVRTEYVHMQSTATTDRFKDAGIEQYRYVANAGERTCEACMERDGQVYSIEDTAMLPPAHPNCRCTIIPYYPNDNYVLAKDMKVGTEDEQYKQRQSIYEAYKKKHKGE